MRLFREPAWAGLMALLLATSVSAQSVSEPLTLRDAVERALRQQPELRAFVFELSAQDARIGEASLAPAAIAEALVEDAGGTGQRRGFASAQTTLSLSHVIELGGKRAGRVAVAEATRLRLLTEQSARQLDVVAEVARRFVETLHERELQRIADEDLQLAERTQSAVGKRVQAALAPAVEGARADVRIAQAKLEAEHAEHELQSSRQWLAVAMGERDVRFADTQGDLFAIDPVAPLDALLARIDSSPDFLLFADDARLRDAEIRLAEVKRRPDIRTQVGVRRYEQGDDVALIAGFSVPLQSPGRARYGIDVARADRARSDAEREAAFLRVQSQLSAQYREIGHAQLEIRVLRESILPRLRDAVERTEVAYQRGRYSYLELTDSQRELLDARRRLVDAAARFHLLRIEIERLTGQSLDTIGVAP